MKKDITKLPKWVQELISKKDFEVSTAKKDLETIKSLYGILSDDNRHWSVITNYHEDSCKLFRLETDRTTCVCDIGRGDALFIGRSQKH